MPTRAEIVAYNLNDAKTPCLTARELDGSLCANAEQPVLVTGEQLDKLVALLRGHATYDRTSASRCFEPHHAITLHYGTSVLDAYTVCLKCRNTELAGTRLPCSDPNQCVDQERLTFTDASFKALLKLMRSAKVKGARG